MVVVPLREHLIILAALVGVFILILVDDRRSKYKNHILNRIFHYFPNYNSDLRVGFSLVLVSGICVLFGVYLYTSLTVLAGGIFFLYKGRN